jgi:hypothetical protein
VRSELAFIGARGVDSYANIDKPELAQSVVDAGAEFAIQYLGRMTPSTRDVILGAGLALMPVTLGSSVSRPQVTLAELRALQLPERTTVWLDVEGVFPDVAELEAEINAWAHALIAAGFEPGIYVGAGCPLTSSELYSLSVVRYWKSLSRITDRHGQIAEPIPCGWCMYQLFESRSWGGLWSDLNVIQMDYHKRLPTWVRA